MCNQYTTGFNIGQIGCGYGYNTCYGNGGLGRQTICRDCCGNIVVRQRRNHCCGCHNCCNCNGNGNGGVTQNGGAQANGRFTCVTFCGVNNTTAATTSAGDLYYARQYGLYPYGCNRGCGCVLDAVNET